MADLSEFNFHTGNSLYQLNIYLNITTPSQ